MKKHTNNISKYQTFIQDKESKREYDNKKMGIEMTSQPFISSTSCDNQPVFKNRIDSEVQTDHHDNNTVIKEFCDQTTATYNSEDISIKPTIHCGIQTDYIFDEENKNIQVTDNSETQTDFEKDDSIKTSFEKKTANAEAQTEFASVTEKDTSEIEVQTDMNDQVSVLEEQAKAIRKELEIKGENFAKIAAVIKYIFKNHILCEV